MLIKFFLILKENRYLNKSLDHCMMKTNNILAVTNICWRMRAVLLIVYFIYCSTQMSWKIPIYDDYTPEILEVSTFSQPGTPTVVTPEKQLRVLYLSPLTPLRPDEMNLWLESLEIRTQNPMILCLLLLFGVFLFCSWSSAYGVSPYKSSIVVR